MSLRKKKKLFLQTLKTTTSFSQQEFFLGGHLVSYTKKDVALNEAQSC